MEQEGRKRGTGVETEAPGMEGGSLGQESLRRESCVRGKSQEGGSKWTQMRHIPCVRHSSLRNHVLNLWTGADASPEVMFPLPYLQHRILFSILTLAQATTVTLFPLLGIGRRIAMRTSSDPWDKRASLKEEEVWENKRTIGRYRLLLCWALSGLDVMAGMAAAILGPWGAWWNRNMKRTWVLDDTLK